MHENELPGKEQQTQQMVSLSINIYQKRRGREEEIEGLKRQGKADNVIKWHGGRMAQLADQVINENILNKAHQSDQIFTNNSKFPMILDEIHQASSPHEPLQKLRKSSDLLEESSKCRASTNVTNLMTEISPISVKMKTTEPETPTRKYKNHRAWIHIEHQQEN